MISRIGASLAFTIDMFGQDREASIANLGKTAAYLNFLGRARFSFVHLHCAIANGRHERRVPFQHSKITLSARYDHHMDVFRADLAGRGHKFKMEWHLADPMLV